MKLTSIAMRNIMRNLRRSLLSGIAIAVSTMSIVLLFAFVQGMIDDMAMNIKSYSTGEIRIRNEAYSEYEPILSFAPHGRLARNTTDP